MKTLTALVVLAVSLVWAVQDTRLALYQEKEKVAHVSERLLVRANQLNSEMESLGDMYYDQVVPIYVELLSTRRVVDTRTALLTAVFVNKYSLKYGMDPRLITAVIKVENPWLTHDTASFAGAIGVMQIMPLWNGEFVECGESLANIETNVCKGTAILAHYLNQENDRALDRALLRYNGCVNTPGCESYSRKVRTYE